MTSVSVAAPLAAQSVAAHRPLGRRCPALTSCAPTQFRRVFLVLLLLYCSSRRLDAEAANANKAANVVDRENGSRRAAVRYSGGKGSSSRRVDGNPNSGGNAQRHMQTFFDNLLQLQYHYGTDVITVRDATEMYPILGQTFEASRTDCPFAYISWQPDRMEGDTPTGSSEGTPHHRKMDDRPMPCFTPVITIHDSIANSWGVPPHQSFNAELPEVLLLSGLGLEEEMDLLGPSSILETIRLLLECARCESLSPWVNLEQTEADDTADRDEGMAGEQDDELSGVDDAFNEDDIAAKPQHTNATQCRQDLAARQIDDPVRKWLARLVATRRIVAVPIADVAGFYHRLIQLEDNYEHPTDEQGIDPEYDFPLPLQMSRTTNTATTACMSTFSARLMNELLRSHAFQLGVAFHSTNEEPPRIEIPSWNAPGKTATYDQRAMEGIARACGDFGFPQEAYPVRIAASEGRDASAFEHFAYAAGMVEGGAGVNNEGSLWMEQCQCDAQDVCTYPSDRTGVYDGSSLRAFVAKVVAMREVPSSIDDLPGFDPSYNPLIFYGSQQPLYERNRLGANVRMSLLAAELVQPWTAVRSVAGVELRDDDIVPLSPRVPGGCISTRRMKLPESSLMSNVTVTWTVGGALGIDETAIMHGKWNVLDSKIFNCVSQPTKQELDTFFSVLRDFEVMEGETTEEMQEDVSFTPVQTSEVTRWHSSTNGDGEALAIPPETTFSVSLDLSHYSVGDVIAIYSLARTDQGWVSGESPTQPQTNVVNARTNPQWSHIHTNSMDGGSLIKGRLDWFSVPVTIEIGPRPGFFEGKKPVEVSVRVSDEGFEPVKTPELGAIAYSLFLAVIVVAITLFCAFCREKRDGTDIFSIWGEHRRIDKQRISMDEFFSDTELTMINMN